MTSKKSSQKTTLPNSDILLLVEAVRAGNDNVGLLTVLALVRRGGGADGAPPEGALDLHPRISVYPSTQTSDVFFRLHLHW